MVEFILKGSMNKDIEKIIRNSCKAELLDKLQEELVNTDKAVVILIRDFEREKYTSQVMLLGVSCSYEAYGILEVAKQDLQRDELTDSS